MRVVMKCANPSTLITDSIRSCYGMADSVIVIWRRTQPPVGALQEVQCKKQHSQSSAPQQQVGLPQLRSRKRVIARPGCKTGNRGVAQLGRAPEKHQYPPAGASTGGRRFESCHLNGGTRPKGALSMVGKPRHTSTYAQ